MTGLLKLFLAFFIGIAVLFPLSHYTRRYIQSSNVHPQVEPEFSYQPGSMGKADYNWILKTLGGQDFNLQHVKGEVVFINIWATWCQPCVEEMPSLQKLYDLLKDEVVFIFISDEDSATLDKFLIRYKYRLPVYRYKQRPWVYEEGGVPVTFIISPDGEILHKELGGPVNWNTQKTVDFLRSLK